MPPPAEPRSNTLFDIVFGFLLGAILGALFSLLAVISSGGAPDYLSESESEGLLPGFVLGLGFAGAMGGLLRPMLHTLRAQSLFAFAASFGLYGGVSISMGDPAPTRTGVLIAAIATPVWVIMGRLFGVFSQIQGDDFPRDTESDLS